MPIDADAQFAMMLAMPLPRSRRRLRFRDVTFCRCLQCATPRR